MCEKCHRLLKRRLLPVDMRRCAKATVPKCQHCKSGVGYAVPQPAEQPPELRGLTAEIVEALRPLSADPGPHQRADQGYRVHTAMARLVWSAKSVKAKIASLPSHSSRKQARRARGYLMSSEESAYKQFYVQHKKFLARAARERHEAQQGTATARAAAAAPPAMNFL